VSPPGDSLLETMSHAADALQCRVAAGRSQLTSAILASEVKQSVIDDATARLTDVEPAAEFAVHVCLLLTSHAVHISINFYSARCRQPGHAGCKTSFQQSS